MMLQWADRRTRQSILDAVLRNMSMEDLIEFRFNVRHMLDRNALLRRIRQS